MSFSETIFLFFLALIIFGPKKLPEMARQAGRLLAELRRASNEFRSQIESEIAHLEIEKEAQKEAQKNQTALPPSPAPQGTVPSRSLSSAADSSISDAPEPAATLAAPTIEAPAKTEPESGSTAPVEAVTEASAPVSQASHV
jgi:sec-independent protein translocase protein TatB